MTCVQDCDTGYVKQINGFTNETVCTKCHDDCAACDGSTSNNCKSCDVGRYLLEEKKQCLPCAEGCLECSGSDKCTKCSQGLFLNAGVCSNACPSSTFPNQATLNCDSCNTGCADCASLAKCDACDVGYYSNPSDQSSCLKCTQNCQKCSSDGTQCLQCE